MRDWKLIPGWLTECEAEKLAQLAAGRRVLEIGSYCGRSSVVMARTALHVDCVDPFDGRTIDGVHTLDEFQRNIERHGVASRVTAHVGTTAECVPQLGVFNLVFIDGDHSYEAVMQDAAHALAHLHPDGLLAFHDYRVYIGEHDGGWDSGVTRAVGELRSRGYKLIAQAGTLAVLRLRRTTPENES